MSRLKVGINGFGRIGRMLFRAGFENLDIVGINDLGDTKIAAHLLKYDSTHGIFNQEVSHDENHLIVGGKKIHMSKTRDPGQIPWKDWGVDVVMECTGVFKNRADVMKHIEAGAQKVIYSAPFGEADLTVVYGINQELYNPGEHQILSNASCTTNCLAPVAKVLHDAFEIEQGLMTTVHSYTNDQRVLDNPHKDLRRARAAALSIIPTTTGAAKAVGLVLPDLNGKLNGISIRVPTPNVSLVDLTVQTKKDVSVESINSAFKDAAAGFLKGVLQYEEAPLVSRDFMGNIHSAIFDSLSTMVMGKNSAKVLAWYDNEIGFSHRMVDLALYMNDKGL